MIIIDLPADLHMEDDAGLNIAVLREAVNPDRILPGAVAVAGNPLAWSWAVVDSVEDGIVAFHQVSADEAAALAPLVASA